MYFTPIATLVRSWIGYRVSLQTEGAIRPAGRGDSLVLDALDPLPPLVSTDRFKTLPVKPVVS